MLGRRKIWLAGVVALLAVGLVPGARADHDPNHSPAECGPEDNPEPGIQGDVPSGETPNYNCGLTLLSAVDDLAGAVQGSGECAYVRVGQQIFVLDVSDPTAPVPVTDVSYTGSSETMRVVTTDERAVLASGNSVYDVSDCRNPVHKGEIQWSDRNYPWPLTPAHDLRITHDATKMHASFGLREADISNLDDSSAWTVEEHTCHVAAQYNPVHAAAYNNGVNLCDHGYWAATGNGQMSHGPDTNPSGSRIYVGAQINNEEELYILDATTDQPTLITIVPNSPGHSIDWFRTADGREFLLHANEGGATTCQPYPPSELPRGGKRPGALDAFITNITDEEAPTRAAVLTLAIDKPENCAAKLGSGGAPGTGLAVSLSNNTVSYHSVDNPLNASFAMVPFGNAGLRIFDIREPESATEVAYFNHGSLVHAGASHYDAERGLIYMPNSSGIRIVGIQPQIFDNLGMDHPARAWWAD